MSEPRNDGGPAFPRPITHTPERDGLEFEIALAQDGMSLRDYFAGQALIGLIAKIPLLKDRDPENVVPDIQLVTERVGIEIRAAATELAYAYADAMLKAREAQS